MRHKHSLSHYRLATFDMGELAPVGCYEVLPGDSVQQMSAALIRVSPLLAPVMHPVTVRLHHWYVPYRLLWAGWEDFITGGSDGLGDSSGAFPTITANFGVGSLGDYLGIPTGTNVAVSALPFRAYAKIFNEFYRDQDLVTELTVNTGSGADATTNQTLQKIAWEKDYFTAARPWPQRGTAVSLPLGTSATVKTNATELHTSASTEMKIRTAAGAVPGSNLIVGAYTDGALASSSTAASAKGSGLFPTNLYADLSGATSATIRELREAFALQSYAEARSMYGARYVEYLRYLGLTPSDARLQRPEYLGGGKQTISFSEVLQTAPDTSAAPEVGVGELKGHGIAALRSRSYRRFFEEHGVVLTLMSVRPKAMYMNGVPRMWLKNTKEDFFQPELQGIGQQEIYNREVRVAHATPAGTFGYQDRYAEYRHQPSQVSGEFRSTLNHWHYAQDFGSDPALNGTFVTCTPTKRVNAVTSTDVLWCMINHNIVARRMVNPPGVGKVL